MGRNSERTQQLKDRTHDQE